MYTVEWGSKEHKVSMELSCICNFILFASSYNTSQFFYFSVVSKDVLTHSTIDSIEQNNCGFKTVE